MSNSNIEIWDVNKQKVYLTLTGHTDLVISLKLLNDGVTLASASFDKTIKTWNIITGFNIQTLIGHTAWVMCVRQLANGYLISGSYDGSIKVWDKDSGVNVQTLENAHNGQAVWTLETLSVGSGSFASSGDDYTIRIWNTSNYSLLRTLTGHSNAISCLKQLSDGTLASGSYDYSVKIWNPETGALLNSFNPLNKIIHALEQVVSSVGMPIILAVGGNASNVAFLNIETGQVNSSSLEHQVFWISSLVYYNSTNLYVGVYQGIFTMSVINPSNFEATGQSYNLTNSIYATVFCLEKSSTIFKLKCDSSTKLILNNLGAIFFY